MKRQIFTIFFLAILVSIFGIKASNAQMLETTAKVGVVRDSVAIGDTVTFYVDIIKDQARYISIPDFSDGKLTDDIEIMAGPFVDSLPRPDDSPRESRLRLRYVVTSFEPQNMVVDSFPVLLGAEPPFDTLFARGNDVLRIGTYLIDTTKDTPVDIRPLLEAPGYSLEELWTDTADFFRGYWWAVLVGVMLGLVGFWLYWRHKNREYRAMIKRLPPHILAISELERISTQKIWQGGRIKEYYSAITDVLRVYAERRWGIQAMEMTSAEVLRELEQLDLTPKLMASMRELFATADMAKFARGSADAQECEEAYYNAYDFVERTKPQLEEPQSDAETPQSENQ